MLALNTTWWDYDDVDDENDDYDDMIYDDEMNFEKMMMTIWW